MKKKIILNEKKFVEDNIINVKCLNVEEIHPDTAIRYLTRYYYKDDMSLNECCDIIFNIMENFKLEVNQYQEYLAKNIINKCYNSIRNGKTKLLREYDSIPLYKSEYDKIMGLCSNKREKKIMFTLYMLARYTNKYGWVYENESFIFNTANVSCAAKDRAKIIHTLLSKGMIKTTKKINDNKIGVELSEGNEDIVFNVSSMEFLGNQFFAFTTTGYKMCCGKNCGKLIKTNSNLVKYCKSCAEKNIRISKMLWWNKKKDTYRRKC